MSNDLNRIKRFEFTNILGWSVSRYDKFSMCKRQYYYDYYAKYDSEYPLSEINKLKKMTSSALEAGNIVHDTIKTLLERLLKSEKPVDTARFMDYAKKMTQEYCSAKTFSEVYYKNVDAMDTDKIFEKVQKCLTNFLNSDRYKWVAQKAVSNKTGWIIEPPGYGETRIKGMKAYCKVDFVFPVEGQIYILDWKTGKQDEKKHKKQLIGYSTWASYHFETAPDIINPMIVYLYPEYSEMQIKVTEADFDGFVKGVEYETREMYDFCGHFEQNVPKDKGEFTQTENQKICSFCNYKQLCGR